MIYEDEIIIYLQNILNKDINIILIKLISYLFNIYTYIVLILYLYYTNTYTTNDLLIFLYIQIIIYIIKNIIKKKRPYENNKNIKNNDLFFNDKYSFPSGHTINAFIIIYLIKNKNKNFIIELLPYLIGISRIYLGVHSVTDILFSILICKFLL
jgi:membrane-associated phospholipid phosphatase